MTSPIECKNFLRSLQLLNSIVGMGVEYFILCPGSRSAPLAIAASELHKKGRIKLFNCIDERSAGFHALGISSASGKNVVVITTSGTAVANLLPSAVEADRSCKNILYITADRPIRLKECGSNQTVNQEEFLIPVCRAVLNTNLSGLHKTSNLEIKKLTELIFKRNLSNPGPIHLNIPFEKPLMISINDKKKLLENFEKEFHNLSFNYKSQKVFNKKTELLEVILNKINLNKPGLIIVGPYRGSINNLLEFNNSLEMIQKITGWPVIADPISGVRSSLRGIVENWELIILKNNKLFNFYQLLRLGPMPASLILEKFLKEFNGPQFLIKENDSRKLDPLRKADEYEYGIKEFVKYFLDNNSSKDNLNKELIPIANKLISKAKRIKDNLHQEVLISDKVTEVSIATLVPEIWPENNPIIISASSPIRDWLTYSGKEVLSRKVFSFRGASGIDGTLSLALGIARILNPLLLVTGDLSFLHDINGMLNQDAKDINLKILLIDNKGGNIFNRIYKNDLNQEEIEKLFLMKRSINWQTLAETHEIPYVDVSNLNNLKEAFKWSLSIQKSVIIRVMIDLNYEIEQREKIFKYLI